MQVLLLFIYLIIDDPLGFLFQEEKDTYIIDHNLNNPRLFKDEKKTK